MGVNNKDVIMKKAIMCAFMAMASAITMASEVEDVAATIWDEARGEGFTGRQYVASVIWNRAKGDGAKMRAVCSKRKQFSGWKNGKPPKVVRKNAKDEAIWKECLAFARALVNEDFKPVTTATHYHATYVKPKWASKLKFVCKIGNHKFYEGA